MTKIIRDLLLGIWSSPRRYYQQVRIILPRYMAAQTLRRPLLIVGLRIARMRSVLDAAPVATMGTDETSSELEFMTYPFLLGIDNNYEINNVAPVSAVAGSCRPLQRLQAAAEVLYVEGDVIPEGKAVGDVKTAAVTAVTAVDAVAAVAAVGKLTVDKGSFDCNCCRMGVRYMDCPCIPIGFTASWFC